MALKHKVKTKSTNPATTAAVAAAAAHRARMASAQAQLSLTQTEILVSSSLLILIHTLTNYTPTLALQDKNAPVGQFGFGIREVIFVGYSVLVLTLARALFYLYVLRPSARFWSLRGKTADKFVEQAWAMVYYAAMFSAGAYLYWHSEYFLSAKDLWVGWPHYQISWKVRAYYLVQLAGWVQQLYVIHVEAKRKDHYQMFTHHVITVGLIVGSYHFHYTRVGHVIQLLMDQVDILLALAKILNYLDWNNACDITFVVFAINWFVNRHVLYNYVVSSAIKAVSYLPQECHFDIETAKLVACFNPKAHWVLVVLLGVLQIITLMWFYMIIRIITKVLTGTASAEDTRSDDEDDEVLLKQD